MERKAVITADSSANLFSAKDAEYVSVPLRIITDVKEYTDDEKLDVPGMLNDLKHYKGKSSTACPSVGDWLKAFGDADEVYGVSITGRLSGCHNAACIAAKDYEEMYPGRKVFILDSLSTGPEMELIIEKYKELIGRGLPFEEICGEIQRYAARTHLIFSLESLTNFVRNGRVSPAVAAAANLLSIRIVGRASSEGELEPIYKSRGEKRAISQLYEVMKESGYEGGKVRIRHSDNENAAQKLAELIRADFPECDLQIGRNNGLCSYYAEKGGILVGYEAN